MIATFNLDRRFKRPVINVMNHGKIYPALIDTGATVPIFTLGRNKIYAFNGKLCKENIRFGGFSGDSCGDLYRLNVELGTLKYIALPMICVHKSEMPFAFIFPRQCLRVSRIRLMMMLIFSQLIRGQIAENFT